MLHDFLWLLSYAAVFGAGFVLCDRMYIRFDRRQKDALYTQYSRIKRDLDADDPLTDGLVPRRRRVQLNNTFIDRLHENGQATTILKNN